MDVRRRAVQLLPPLAIDGLTLAAICGLHHMPAVLTGVIGAIFVFALAYRFSRFRIILTLFAGAFGTGGEILCCAPGIALWVYRHPGFLGIPIWLPMIWPILMMTFGDMSEDIHDLLNNHVRAGLGPWIWRTASALIFAYAAFTFFRIQWIIALVFFVFLCLMAMFARRPRNLILFYVSALGGSLGEWTCIQFGVWHYTRPFFGQAGIPLSLPLAWGLSANIIFMLARLCSLGREESR